LYEKHLSFEFPKALLRAICGMSITLRQKVTDSVPLCVRRWYLQFAPAMTGMTPNAAAANGRGLQRVEGDNERFDCVQKQTDRNASPDRGCVLQLCPFESGVIGIGPQLGFIIPAGSLQAYINLKAYGEFDGDDRPSGWNAWLTLSFSPSAPTNPKTASEIRTSKATRMV
jgi:hypothetical protein